MWEDVETESAIHVIPVCDKRTHVAEFDCACKPAVTDGGKIVVHRAWDCREAVEMANRILAEDNNDGENT